MVMLFYSRLSCVLHLVTSVGTHSVQCTWNARRYIRIYVLSVTTHPCMPVALGQSSHSLRDLVSTTFDTE